MKMVEVFCFIRPELIIQNYVLPIDRIQKTEENLLSEAFKWNYGTNAKFRQIFKGLYKREHYFSLQRRQLLVFD